MKLAQVMQAKVEAAKEKEEAIKKAQEEAKRLKEEEAAKHLREYWETDGWEDLMDKIEFAAEKGKNSFSSPRLPDYVCARLRQEGFKTESDFAEFRLEKHYYTNISW